MSAPITPTGTEQAHQEAQNRPPAPKMLGEGHIMGNLTDDPELRFTPTGRAVAKMSVAYTPRVKNDQTGKWDDGPVEFYTLNVWGQQAERAAEFLQRGDRVVAAGTWTERTWEDREGKPRVSVELTCRDVGPSLLFKGATIHRPQNGQEAAPSDQ